jgi:hypothetical protein
MPGPPAAAMQELTPGQLAAAMQELTPGQLAAATAELDAAGIPFGYAASPACLPASAYAAMRSAWQAFAAGVAAFVSRHDGRPADMAAELRLPAGMVPVWQSLPETEWALIGRPDMVMSSGVPMMVDLNVTGLAGLLPLNDMLLRSHRAPGLAEVFRRPAALPRFLMGHYADILRRYLTSDGDLIALTICAWEADDPHYAHWHYQSEIAELARFGLTAEITFAEDLDITPGGVSAGGRNVGLIRRYFNPRPDNPGELAELARISAALRNCPVRVLTGLHEEILSTKSTLAVLSDERFTDGLAPSLAGRLRRAIPWTRGLEERHTIWRDSRIDLLPWVEANRTRLVLKPALGYAGMDVTVGRETPDREWADLIGAALADAEPWVVQEVLDPDEEDVVVAGDGGELRQFRVPVVYGCYVLEGQFVGAIRRHGIRGSDFVMINGTVGAVPAPVYWR